VAGNQCFTGSCCLHLHFTLKVEAARSSEMLISYHITRKNHNPEDYDLNIHSYENPKYHSKLTTIYTMGFANNCFIHVLRLYYN